jgi:hypothetical protein
MGRMSEEPTDRTLGSDSDPSGAQLVEARARLQRDGVAVGLNADEVGRAVDAAAAQYATAPVQAFVSVLVERAVRQELSIPRSPT